MSLPGPRYEWRWLGRTNEIRDTHTGEILVLEMDRDEAHMIWIRMNLKWDRNSLPISTIDYYLRYVRK